MGAIRCQIWLHKSLKHNHPRNVQVFRNKIALFPMRTYSRWPELKLSIFVLTPTWGDDAILLTVINQRLELHCRPPLGQAAMFLCMSPPCRGGYWDCMAAGHPIYAIHLDWYSHDDFSLLQDHLFLFLVISMQVESKTICVEIYMCICIYIYIYVFISLYTNNQYID